MLSNLLILSDIINIWLFFRHYCGTNIQRLYAHAGQGPKTGMATC